MVRAHVVVAAYQQEAFLPRVLAGYLRQDLTAFHVTIADDGSGPATAEQVEQAAPAFAARGIGLAHVWHEDRGFRKCRILNEAVRRGPPAPLLVFSDADCIPPADFVARHLAVHEPRSLHVGGARRLERGQSDGLDAAAVASGAFESLHNAASRRDLARKRRQSLWGTRLRRRNRPKILGLNFAIDRALFEELNGFDERFESWGLGEDTDLRDRAMRLRPRPRVKVLYTVNDVVHLWHTPNTSQRLEGSRAYYRLRRPVRCEHGLRDERPADAR